MDIKEWKIGIEYRSNDIVIFDNQVYICLYQHQSAVYWTPEKAYLIWKKIS